MKYHIALIAAMLIGSVGCFPKKPVTFKPGTPEPRKGDEIIVAGQMFHTGTRVVTWMDPGGFDAYRTERRFAPWDKASYEATTREVKGFDSANRYGVRFAPRPRPSEVRPSAAHATTAPSTVNATTAPATAPAGQLTDAQLEMVRGGGWPLALLQDKVDQFVLHFDVCGTSRQCFNILQDHRDLSVTFMLDIDGTIYQTLDCKEKAWQATIANSRSLGIEIANIGAYPVGDDKVLREWYRKDPTGRTRIVLPPYLAGHTLTPGFVGYPIRNDPVQGVIQHDDLRMYDLTPQQYDALIHLTATLCTVFPKIKCDYPKDADGKLIPHTLSPDQYDHYHGVLGHYHVQDNKNDPGPALQWDKLIDGARALMTKP